ncbi:hypothetical protein [Hydrogenophaga sp. 2FB]|uniref:hypothetical protein n=1 Tax=Hydrogenophaga sp. 2FB TaxID=2502187 RepID=UPI0010F585EC|nr:hypothetical protein [Hydrogenophaga sp. 2FB]
MNALGSSSRRDAMATRAAARRRVLEPLTERVTSGAAHGVADLPAPESLPRYLELGGAAEPETVQATLSGEGVAAPSPSGGRLGWGQASQPDQFPRAPTPTLPQEGRESEDAMAAHETTHAVEAETEADTGSTDTIEMLDDGGSPVAILDGEDEIELLGDEAQEEDAVLLDDAETAAEEAEGEAEAEAEEGGGESEEAAADEEGNAAEATEGEATAEGGGTAEATAEGEGGEGDATALDDTALIDEELAEHERWAGSFGDMGTAGSDDRARFLLDQAGQGASAGFWGGVGMGAVMGAAGGALGHIAGRRLATLAVSRGATAVPVPGLGPAIGGVMAIAGLFTRDWGASFDTIGRVGTGEGYEGLANDLEGIAEALDMACTFMDIVGGICGAIAVGMWVGAVLSGGALAPLALTLSAIGTGISLATTAVGLIINIAVRPAVTALRAMHAFETQGDPAAVEAAGASLSSAAAQLTGAAGGALGGRAGGHIGTRGGAGLYRGGRALAARRTGGRPAMSAAAGPGPRLHVEMPEAPAVRPVAADAPAASVRPADTATPAIDVPAPITRPADATPAAVDLPATSIRPADTGTGTGTPPAARPARAPAARAPGRPRSGGARPMDTRIHNAELRSVRDRAEARLGIELTPDQVRSLEIRESMAESGAVGRPDADLHNLPGPEAPAPAGRGDRRAWTHPDSTPGRPSPDQARVEGSIRREAAAEFNADARAAVLDEGLHTASTLESTSYLSPHQRETLAEAPVSRSERRDLRDAGEPIPGRLPDDFQFHHRMTVRDHPEVGHRGAAGVSLPDRVHRFEEHGGDYRAEIELLGPRDPGALDRGFGSVREATPGARTRHSEVAAGFTSTGDVDADIRIEYGNSHDANRGMVRTERALARLRAENAAAPSDSRTRTIARMEAELRAARDFAGPGPTGRRGTSTAPTTAATAAAPAPTSTGSGPAASSPRARSTTAPDAGSTAPPRYASDTETARTSDRAAAMAQYHDQIRTDPNRESGVWRGEDGTFYVMQGDAGSVAPPSSAGPLTLVYHSHPVEADAAYRGLVSQPSQANGDFGVLAYQHGESGAAGRRIESELHFPTYAPDGTHAGFGATRFAYDPTSPLPLQVSTTLPGGRASTQRYESFADYEARTGIVAGGDTPDASTAARVEADAQLTTDRAAASRRIDETAAGLAGRRVPVGASVGRDEARSAEAEMRDEGAAAATASTPADPHGRGPAYAVSVAGLNPGESMELPINPAYPPPPGTPDQLDALLEQVDTARRTADVLSDTEDSMAANTETELEHQSGLEEATVVGEDLTAERETHAGEVDTTTTANDDMLTQAGEAYDSLGNSAREAGALASLVTSLQAFRGMAHLFSYLPGSLGESAETARDDSARLIETLNRVSDADAAQANVDAGRENIEGDGERIDTVTTEGETTDTTITEGTDALVELQATNEASLAETQATHEQATSERRAAEDSESDAQGAHDSLLAELQAWAQQHQQARETAVSQALGTYEGMGLTAREIP